jgi:hypothetical protein
MCGPTQAAHPQRVSPFGYKTIRCLCYIFNISSYNNKFHSPKTHGSQPPIAVSGKTPLPHPTKDTPYLELLQIFAIFMCKVVTSICPFDPPPPIVSHNQEGELVSEPLQ